MNNLKKFTTKDRYGNSQTYEFESPVKPVDQTALMKAAMEQMDAGMPQMSQGVPHPGQPQGTDTVPAWLTPGEFVINKEATDLFGPQIEQMNDIGRQVQDTQQVPGGRQYGTPGLAEDVARMESEEAQRAQAAEAAEAARVSQMGFANGGMVPRYYQDGDRVADQEWKTDWGFPSISETWEGIKDTASGLASSAYDNTVAAVPRVADVVLPPSVNLGLDIAGAGFKEAKDRGLILPEQSANPELDALEAERVRREEGGASPAELGRLDRVIADRGGKQPQISPEENAEIDRDIAELKANQQVTAPNEAAVDAFMAERDKALVPLDSVDPTGELIEAGKQADTGQPGLLSQVMTGFKESFGRMIGSEDDLYDAALYYLGSRALGYDHRQSLGGLETAWHTRAKRREAEGAKIRAEERADARTTKKMYTQTFAKNKGVYSPQGQAAITQAINSGDMFAIEQAMNNPENLTEKNQALSQFNIPPGTKTTTIYRDGYKSGMEGYDLGGGNFVVQTPQGLRQVNQAHGFSTETVKPSELRQQVSSVLSDRYSAHQVDGKSTSRITKEDQVQILINTSDKMGKRGLADDPRIYTNQLSNVIEMMNKQNIPLDKASVEAMLTSAIISGGTADWSKVSKEVDGRSVPLTAKDAIDFGDKIDNIFDKLPEEKQAEWGSTDAFLKSLSGGWDPTKLKGFSKERVLDGTYNPRLVKSLTLSIDH